MIETQKYMTEHIGIIGGGILGIAVARELTRRGIHSTVLEKERRLAVHQTGNNSGVVHAGLYYAPGSLKALLCAKGRALTQEFCQEKRLPYEETGKLVVALNERELAGLSSIESNSQKNNVPGLKRVSAAEMRDIEPHVAGIAALHSPRTAVVDYSAIAEAMADDVRRAGGKVLLGHEVTAITQELGKVRVTTEHDEFVFDRLVVCAGLQSDLVARMLDADASPKILPFRGEYWAMKPERSDMIKGMIYPVPDPRFPFLGIHFTRGVYGNVHVGPNAVPALAREGYSWGKISLKDTWASITWPGAPAMLRRHWKMGYKEISSSLIKPLYFREARKYIPELTMGDLTAKTEAGVRAQAWGRDGALLDDFAVDQIGVVTMLRNAPSPAATSSMAIAEYLVDHNILATG
jgi:L-2-hydroxyglutarate oxidase LhgO